MNRFLKISVLALVIVFINIPFADAQWVIDIPGIATKITHFVSETSKVVNQTIEPVVQQYQTIKKGLKGAMESAEMIKKGKEMYEKTRSAIDEAKETYSKIQNTVGEVKNVYDQAKGAYDTAKGTYDKAMDAKSQIEEKTKQFTEQQNQLSGNLIELKKNLQSVEAEKNDYIASEKAALNAQITALRDNNKVLETMRNNDSEDADFQQNQIKQNEETIAEIQQRIYALPQSQAVLDYERQQEELNMQIKEREEQIKNIALQVASVAATVGAGLLDKIKNRRAQKMQEYANNAFLDPTKANSGEAHAEWVKKNKVIALNDTLDAYTTALDIKRNIQAYNKANQELQNKVMETDSQTGSVLAEVSGVRVAQMRMVLNYIKLQIAELKMLTANDMANLSADDMVGYVPETEFSFDNYIYEPEGSASSSGSRFGK